MIDDKTEKSKNRKFTQDTECDYTDLKAHMYQNPSSGALISANTPKYQLNYLPSSHYSNQSNVSISKVIHNYSKEGVKIQMYAQDEGSRESSS